MVNDLPLRVLFLASEADPFVKIGGLGDVAGSLPLALRRLSQKPYSYTHDTFKQKNAGVDIRLVIPFHDVIRQNSFSLHPVASFNIPHKDGPIPAEVYERKIIDLTVYLISGPPFPPGAPVYTGNNEVDGYKYTFFSMAALKLPYVLGWKPHILHANDWHTAPAVYALKQAQSSDSFYKDIRSILGIHNLSYLGLGAGQALQRFGLPPANNSLLPEWAQNLPLPLGLLAADKIIAVSPGYAKDILTPEFGSGLDEFLNTNRQLVSGILNGIDTHHWNPSTDPQINVNYSVKELVTRDLNKSELTRELGLDQAPHTPLLAMITQMDREKGVDLVLEALRQLATSRPEIPWHAILLGTGASDLEAGVKMLEIDFPKRVRAALRTDARLASRIYAGADIILIPSRIEPCGMIQMIAMHYGCVPIGRATGGLRDTIRDANFSSATGFLFENADSKALLEVILRATSTFTDRRRWRRLQRCGMNTDFSWERSARQYLQIYRTLILPKRWSSNSERKT
jgi:starch synthase